MKKDEYINVLNQVIKQINHSWDLNTAQKKIMGLFGKNIIPFDKIELDKAWQAVTTPRGSKLNSSVYNAMEASGIIYKIEDDSIRNEILDLYQHRYEWYHHVIDYDLTHIQKMDDIILKDFILLTDNKSWNLDWSKDLNIDQMLSNHELRNYIAANRGTKNIMKNRAKRLIERIESVTQIIDKY
ncbi:hypothetical protein OAR31_02275 [Candidatus Marinimicrobia bacterium]|nr:hypothetical protein [Candidatus Neomarinimicrobiota bacterium]